MRYSFVAPRRRSTRSFPIAVASSSVTSAADARRASLPHTGADAEVWLDDTDLVDLVG